MGNCESRNAETRNGSTGNVVSHRKLYENDAGSHDQRIAFAAATSCNSTAILRRPSSLSLKTFRDIFPLEPVNRFTLLAMQMSLSDFARLQYTTTYMHKSHCSRNLMEKKFDVQKLDVAYRSLIQKRMGGFPSSFG